MASPPAIDAVSHLDHDDELLTGEAVGLDLRPTGFVLRAAGAVIDFVVYLGAYLAGILLLISVGQSLQVDEATFSALAIALLVLCIVVAPTTVELLSNGKSLGRLVVGARIVRDDGGAIGFRHAFIRALTGVLELFATFGGIAVLVALLNGRSKRLGDLVAGTYSQNERVARTVRPVFGVPVELQDWARTADVAKMPDGLGRRISQYLAQAGALTPDTRDRVGRQLATEASIYVSPLPRVGAEHFLAAVAAVRRDREFAALESERRGLERLAPVLGGLPHGFPDR